MALIEARLERQKGKDVPFVFDSEKVLAPDNISVAMATHGMWLAAESHRGRMSILDLGSGSGIMAVAAMLVASSEGRYEITAVDIDDEPLKTTKANLDTASKHITTNVGYQVLRSDWFSNVPAQGFDLIMCNPPFLNPHDTFTHTEALTAPWDTVHGSTSLEAYEIIAPQLQSYLTDFGVGLFRTQLEGEHRDQVKDIFRFYGLAARAFGTHDGTREGRGLTVFRSNAMPPGLALPIATVPHLDLVYPEMHIGGTQKPLTEEGKYWHSVYSVYDPEDLK